MDPRDRELLLFSINMYKDAIMFSSKYLDIISIYYSGQGVKLGVYTVLFSIIMVILFLVSMLVGTLYIPYMANWIIFLAIIILFVISIMYLIYLFKIEKYVGKDINVYSKYVDLIQNGIVNDLIVPLVKNIVEKYRSVNLCYSDRQLLKIASTILDDYKHR